MSSGTGAAHPTGSWALRPDDRPLIRLTSQRVGLVSLDVTAPVVVCQLNLAEETAELVLQLSLNELKTGNFLMQGAARALVRKFDGDALTFDATGAGGPAPWAVAGIAHSGHVDVPLEIKASPVGPGGDPMSHLHLTGTAVMEEVNIPLPGIGRIKDFTFAVEGRVGLDPA
jgi:hypothetical protein